MAKELAIRVKVFEKCEYIKVTEEMLSNHEIFLRHVLDYFGLDPIQCANTYLFDQDNFPISPELYSIIMPQFTNPTVYIKLVFNLHEDTGFDLALGDFLKQNGCKSIFQLSNEACKSNKELDVRSIHFLAEKLIHFMDNRKANGQEVDAQQVADSLVRLMPCIDMETLYVKNTKKGIFYNKLTYRKYAKQNKKSQEEEDNVLAPVVDSMATMTIEEELQTLLFFKTCSVNREMDILKIKLDRSVSLREKAIRKRETKFAESFPFYFVSPDLVRILYDYNIRFPGKDCLIEKWPSLMIEIIAKLLIRSDAEACTDFGFDNQTTSFIMLLRKFSMKKSFGLNVAKFIVYSENINGSPENLIDKKRCNPYIIAVGETKENISNYYIDIEETLIPVPSDFDFLKTFDMFYKCHKVFHLEYNSSIVKMMHFIDFYLYENKENPENEMTITMVKAAAELGLL